MARVVHVKILNLNNMYVSKLIFLYQIYIILHTKKIILKLTQEYINPKYLL